MHSAQDVSFKFAMYAATTTSTISRSAGDAAQRVVLLFVHGGSYNKDCWKPILRRLQSAPLLQRVPCEIASFNWRFHGEKRDRSIQPKLHFRNGRETSPRVEHPMREWTEWAPVDLFNEIEKIRADDAKLMRRTRIVGVGHSMGATSLIQTELSNPGTLDGIVAFEPVYSDGTFSMEFKESVVDMLVGVTIAREAEWNSWEDVLNHLKTARNFKRWHPESVEAFLENGFEKTEDGQRWRLVVSPTVEAAVYCHEFLSFHVHDFARSKCKIVLEHAEKTPFFRPQQAREAADQLPGQLAVAEAIPKTTHSMIVEDPSTCAAHILNAFETFPVFQNTSASAKL